jgi:hypothetical protein
MPRNTFNLSETRIELHEFHQRLVKEIRGIGTTTPLREFGYLANGIRALIPLIRAQEKLAPGKDD